MINLYFQRVGCPPMRSDLSIPRLELLGVVIGCRASRYVADHLGMPNLKRRIFTDSKCVIEWSTSKKGLKRFVSERITEIKGNNVTLVYVKSKDKPADIATRGETVKNLNTKDLWWKGSICISLPYHE